MAATQALTGPCGREWSTGRWLEPAELTDLPRQLGSIARFDHVQDLADVKLDRALTQVHVARNFAIGLPVDNESQDPPLDLAQGSLRHQGEVAALLVDPPQHLARGKAIDQIGRASCRERGAVYGGG